MAVFIVQGTVPLSDFDIGIKIIEIDETCRLIQIENDGSPILERRWAGRLRTALRKQGKNYLKNGELGDEMFEH